MKNYQTFNNLDQLINLIDKEFYQGLDKEFDKLAKRKAKKNPDIENINEIIIY